MVFEFNKNAFSQDYFGARDKFREACRAHGLPCASHPYPANGPQGQALSVEVAYAGPDEPEKLLVTISGVHGVEGMAGSGCQIDLIQSDVLPGLAKNCGILFIHFLNPYGAAWSRTETHENVDLNRNFLDFSNPLPANPDYDDVHGIFMCPEIKGPVREKADRELSQYIDEKSFARFLQACAMGQYSHPDGFGFGGHGPAWSNSFFRDCLGKYGAHASQVIVVDYHTGLGPYGYGMVIAGMSEQTATGKALRKIYGPSAVFNDAGDIGYRITGSLDHGSEAALPGRGVLSVALEFGTYEVMRLVDVTRNRIWLSNHGDFDSELGRKIAQDLMDVYYCQYSDWQEMIQFRSRQVIAQSLAALTDA